MDYLFRGFHEYEDGEQIAVVDGKEHKGEWIDGYFFKIWHEYYILWGTTNGIPNMLEVLPETVGMWTGLTDKNGKKIFEGDILESENCEGCKYKTTIVFEDGCFFTAYDGEKNEDIKLWLDGTEEYDGAKIIGTIFDKEAQ